MTRRVFAYAGLPIAVLAALGTQLEPPEQAGETRVEVAGPTVPEVREEALDTPQAAYASAFSDVAVVTPTPRPRSSRRWTNRYPGPIPTPADWRPPEGPVKIALQAGHWRAHEAPHELRGIRGNGTRWERVREWEVNLAIAERTADMLRELGYEVEILPAVVPPGYRAHLFISIHADGAADPRASGYRVAPPRYDFTGRATAMASLLEERYGEETGLRRIPTVTRRMSNYYAFNFRRYEHALHPMTIAVILETGFLTSGRDRQVILDDPDRAARGIVAAVTEFPITPPPRATEVAAAVDGSTR